MNRLEKIFMKIIALGAIVWGILEQYFIITRGQIILSEPNQKIAFLELLILVVGLILFIEWINEKPKEEKKEEKKEVIKNE